MTEFKENSAEEVKPNITLDFGAGSIPLICFNQERISELQNNPSKRYLLVDSDNAELQNGKFLVERQRALKSVLNQIEFIHSNGREIPVEDSTISEVIISNVFGDPSGSIGKFYVLKEIDRVLKTGGIIKIIECNTPKVAGENISQAKELLIETLGYEMIKEICVKLDDPFTEETDSDASLGHKYMNQDTFIWAFKKK